jgi:GTP cyclohydrolase IA
MTDALRQLQQAFTDGLDDLTTCSRCLEKVYTMGHQCDPKRLEALRLAQEDLQAKANDAAEEQGRKQLMLETAQELGRPLAPARLSYEPVNVAKLTAIGQMLLEALGYDPLHPSIVDTPLRWARSWAELLDYRDDNTATVFTPGEETDQMVVVGPIRVWSYCEHHLMPFWCDITIGYIADGKVLGLSKFARIARLEAQQLQIQERLVQSIADRVSLVAGTEDVAVQARGQHLCMCARGIRSDGLMSSSICRGRFRHQPETREEWLHFAGAGR